MGEAPGAMAGGVKPAAHFEVNCSEIAFAIAQLSLALVRTNLAATADCNSCDHFC
jgi:hypothetical protein